MLDLRFIRENPDTVRENLRKRGASVDLDALLSLDQERRQLITDLEELRRQRNELAKSMKGRKPSDAEREQGRELKQREPGLQAELERIEAEIDALLRTIPNLVQPDVPEGASEEANLELRRSGQPREFDFEPRDHLELVALHDLVDFEAGAKTSGQKFYFLKNEAVLLEQGLIRYALDRARAHGFTLFHTPDLARREVCAGTGYNPSGPEKQIYTIEDEDLALIGTAEITLSGMHAGDIFEAQDLPLRYCGFSHCFRMEAGAAGRGGRGLYRVHQFSKVELFAFTHPDESEAMFQEILEIEEGIFQGLELPFRVLALCGGDSAAQSARTYDIEAWMPGRDGGSYGEVTSASNCTDFQARRLDIRFRDADTRKTRYVHMLNGTAIALPRTLIPLLENHQQRDGSITIPEALRVYTGFDRIG
ncbi:MAG: serine--tRNA ligase [Myxococcales bacterium]|nr:serine--tRNA ligase [Myxococcales bacterium]